MMSHIFRNEGSHTPSCFEVLQSLWSLIGAFLPEQGAQVARVQQIYQDRRRIQGETSMRHVDSLSLLENRSARGKISTPQDRIDQKIIKIEAGILDG